MRFYNGVLVAVFLIRLPAACRAKPAAGSVRPGIGRHSEFGQVNARIRA